MKKLMILVLSICILCLYLYFEINFPKIATVSMKTNKLLKDEKIKILQISDVHNKKIKKGIFKKIEKLSPDIIVITGDLIDGKTKEFKNVYGLIEKLVKMNPNTYFVSGNHEWRNMYTKSFLEGLIKRKVRVINNTNTVFSKGTAIINICGIDDPYSHHEAVGEAFSHVDPSNFTVLLAHSPNIIMKEENLPVDLLLCGHTHGGQVRLPMVGAVVAPGQGWFPKYDKGIFKVWENTTMYIDSGFGNSVLPLRFLNRSQMSMLTIEGK